MIYNTQNIIIDRIRIKNKRVYTQYSKHLGHGQYATYSNAKPCNNNIKLDIDLA